MTDINSTLPERGERYGSFEHHAKIAQDLQRVMHAEAGWLKLADDQRQALTVIADKIARMLNWDPAYRDNWHDIVGYAKLVDDRMKRDNLAVFRANEAQPAPMPESAPTHTGGAITAKPADVFVGEEPSEYKLPPVKNPLPTP